MKKTGIIGHFGFGFKCYDGQTVKTIMIAEELERQLKKENVSCYDTHGGIKKICQILFSCIKCLKKCDNVVAMPDSNGVKVIFPWLVAFNRAFKRRIHYVVIGGWLPEFVAKRKYLSGVLKKLDGIYVETNTMKKALESQGFENIHIMPNCKKLTVLSEEELVYPEGVPYKLCTFSRVMKEKGIEDAVNAVIKVNTELGYTAYTLDIYGQVDANQTEWFDELQSSFPEYIFYGGLVPFDKSVEVLKNYFALLFPTYYEGEGFAGTLIDAFSAGVPVIASDWKYNSEIVNERVGYVYPAREQKELEKILFTVVKNPNDILSKKSSCLEESRMYDIERTVRVLTQFL